MRLTPCGSCKTYWTHGATVGCCGACHRAFKGLEAFQDHQVGPRDERGRLTCLDPATATYAQDLRRAGEPIFELACEDLCAERGPLWRLVPSARQVADLLAVRQRREAEREQAK